MPRSLAHLTAVLLLAAAPAAAAAQVTCSPVSPATSCSVTSSVSATIPTVTKLTISAATATFPAVATTIFDTADSATVSQTGTTLTVISNKTWSLSVQAGADFFTGGSGTKASTDLSVSFNGGSYVAVPKQSGTATTLLSNQAAGRVTGALNYQLLIRITEAPGTYTLPVKFTITAP